MPAAAAWFKVAPERLVEQGKLSLSLLRDPENAPRRAELAVVGLEGARFTFALEDALAGLEAARAEQLRLSEALEEEREQDRIWKADTERWVRGITKWMQDELTKRGTHPSAPPQRSVTPVYGTRAVDMTAPPKRVPTHAGDDEP